MNPYKKIDKLQNTIANMSSDIENMQLKIDRLERENALLKKQAAIAEQTIRLAKEHQAEYEKLLVKVKKAKEQYDNLIHLLKFSIKKNPELYRKKVKELNKAFK